MIQRFKGVSALTLALILAISIHPTETLAAGGHVLKFSGVPLSQGNVIRKRFPFVFERDVTLSEVDEVVQYLMGTGSFSNIEVVQREGNDSELLLVASLLRKIKEVKVQGNSSFSTNDVLEILNISAGQAFERKNLINAADDLRVAYENRGYHGAKVEIEFELPNDTEVSVIATIKEGQPLKITDATVETPNKELSSRLKRLAKSLNDKVLTDDTLTEFSNKAGEFLRDNRYLTARMSAPAITYNAERTQAKLSYTVDNPVRF